MHTHKLFIFTALITALPASDAAAQQLRSHEVGRLWDSYFQTGTYPEYAPLQDQMTYPGGDFFFQTPKNLERRGLWIGVTSWTDKFGVTHPKYVSEGGPLNFEALQFVTGISHRKFVRERLPIVEVNGTREGRYLDSRSGSTRKRTLASDENIRTIWASDVGITVTRNTYAFANRNHDSYIIQEFVLENTGNIDDNKSTIELPDQHLQGVYFSFVNIFLPSGDIGHQQTNEHDDWVHYYGNQPGDSLRGLWYAYDGDAQGVVTDDIGDPHKITGEILSPQYVGIGVLHADASFSDETDDRSQPSTVNHLPSRRWRSKTQGDTDDDMYREISSGVQSQGTDTGEFADAWDPEIQHPMLLTSFGPYDIPFGEDVRIVLYEVAGSINEKLAITQGQAWKNGQLQFHGLSGDEAKNALIATGKDSILQNASRAEWAWANNLTAVADGPPAPSLRLDSGPGKIELDWDSVEDKKDPDTGVLDFAGYRVYRTEGQYTKPYNLIWECGGNTGVPVTTSYVDRDVERGVNYYYYVTAYDDGSQNINGLFPGQSLESSHYYNRNFQFAAVPNEAARTSLDSVFVVPNPFHAQGHAFGGTLLEDYAEIPRKEDQISFVGLPARATIRIFTVHGDLVTTLEHPNPTNPLSIPESSDEAWFQITDNWQTIKSGVYFFHVEGWDIDGNALGTTTGKFIVIR